MKRSHSTFAQSFAHFLRAFLTACLLSIALTFFLVATNVVMAKGIAVFG